MWIFKAFLFVHVATGAVGLVALWPPLLGRKGNPLHKRAGRVFAYALLVTSACAVGMSLCTLYAPAETHPHIKDLGLIVGLFGWMMLYLSVFTMTLLWFGLACIRNRRDHAAHRNPLTLGLQAATLATALLCAFEGWRTGQPLMILISGLGLTAATLNTRFILTSRPPPNEWLVQHMRSFVGAGVSVYTAFFSFGAANLLPQIAFNPLLWAAPTVTGIAVILYQQRAIRAAPTGRRPLQAGHELELKSRVRARGPA
jgi:hypothetical protein